MSCIKIIILNILLLTSVENARILAVYPFASISHQVVFRPLTFELAKRGHDLVVITPDPVPKEELPENVTEIDTSAVYAILRKGITGKVKPLKGVKVTAEMLSIDSLLMITKTVDETFSIPEVKNIINDPNEKFDLVIAESIFQLPVVLAKVFNASLILFSSYYGTPYNYDVMGAPTRHPMLYPNPFRNKFFNLSLMDKVNEIYMELKLWYLYYYKVQMEEELLKKHFGNINVGFDELNDLIDLMFVNVNTIFEGNRPMPPNMINLGGMHLEPPKELSKEWQAYLDSSKRGVIYVSLGTNVRPSTMDPTLLEVFMSAFEQLPYDILWKFDGDTLRRKLNNVRVENWFPQRELLFHPNVKAFVTQGGLQSTDEAIDSAIPMIGLPMLADQSYNCEKIEQLGIGVNLDVVTLTTEQLVDSIKTVAENESYRENIKKIRKWIRDQPQTPLERAVWWTEYVLRHSGAKHLRSPQANMSWSEYLLLDVISLLVVFSSLVLLLGIIIVKSVKKMISTKMKDD